MDISFNLTTGEIIGWELDAQPMIGVDVYTLLEQSGLYPDATWNVNQ